MDRNDTFALIGLKIHNHTHECDHNLVIMSLLIIQGTKNWQRWGKITALGKKLNCGAKRSSSELAWRVTCVANDTLSLHNVVEFAVTYQLVPQLVVIGYIWQECWYFPTIESNQLARSDISHIARCNSTLQSWCSAGREGERRADEKGIVPWMLHMTAFFDAAVM